MIERAASGPAGLRALQFHGKAAEASHKAGRKSSAWGVTAGNYSGAGSFGETRAINGPSRREADWATTLRTAGGVDSPLSCPTL